MKNIDTTIQNVNGQRAKDITNSKHILEILAWHEQNKAVAEEKITDNVAAIKEEEENDDDGMSSNFTPSPGEFNLLKLQSKVPKVTNTNTLGFQKEKTNFGVPVVFMLSSLEGFPSVL